MTFLQSLQVLKDAGEPIPMILPGYGFIDGTIDGLEDDAVTVAVGEGEKLVLHHSQVVIRRR